MKPLAHPSAFVFAFLFPLATQLFAATYETANAWVDRTTDKPPAFKFKGGALVAKDVPFYVFGRAEVPVRPGFRYRLTGSFRAPESQRSLPVSFGVQLLDAERRALNGSTSLEITDTFTVLTAPAQKGARTICVADALYWRRGLVAFGASADGSDFPNRSAGLGCEKSIRLPSGDWEVMLTGQLRASWPAGTGVRLQPGGPAYLFSSSSSRDGAWHVLSGEYSLAGGESVRKLWRGTAFIRPVAYGPIGKPISLALRGVRIEELPDLPPPPAKPPQNDGSAKLSAPPDYRAPSLNKVKFGEDPVHAPLKLVSGGRLRFAIVAARAEEKAFRSSDGQALHAGKMSIEQSVRVLCEGFAKACGRMPEVLEPDDPSLERWPYWILVGRSVHTDRLGIDPAAMPREGFEVRTFSRGIAIVGMDGFRIPGLYDLYDFRSRRLSCNGTLWGAWDFRERFLDQRHYYQREGEVIPRLAADFSVPPVAYSDAPQYWCRGYHLNHGAFRAGNSSRFFGGESPHPFDLIKAYPSRTNDLFMTDAKGKLQCDPAVYGRNMFDVSNPVFAETLAESFARYFETKGAWNPLWGQTFIPNSEWCWFGQCDRSGRIENDRTRDLIEYNVAKNDVLTPTNYPASATMSSVYAEFFDRFGRLMEKAAPGRKISCEVYSDYLYPPTKWKRKFPENIRIMVCYGTPPLVVNPSYRDAYRMVYEGWGKLCADKVVPYIYSAGWSFGAGIQLSLQGWYMGDFLRTFADVIDNRNAYACLCGWTKDYFYAINLCARAMWNPSFDRAAVMDDMWKRLYPPAAATPLKAFHDDVLRVWETKTMPGNPDTNLSSLAGPRYANLYATYDAAWIRASEKLLDEARRAVVPGTVEGARVERFLKPWLRLFAARLDGEGQRMVTDERPNRVQPAFTNGVFRWSDLAWRRSDFRGTHRGEPCVGFAPRPSRPNPYADDWYRQGSELTLSAVEGKPLSAEERARNGRDWSVPALSARPSVFSIEACAAHHPLSTARERRDAPPVRATIYVNGRARRTFTLDAESWKRVSVELPPGTLLAGKDANTFAVSNETVLATASLPVSWLAVRTPELKLSAPAKGSASVKKAVEKKGTRKK